MSGNQIDRSALPDGFPTHRHATEFWEALGRTVATFGFLEEVLGKAIFALTATRQYAPSEIQAAYEAWLPQLEHALTDALGNLIDVFGKALREHQDAPSDGIDDLLGELRKAAEFRNIVCHGSWRTPDEGGWSRPLFVHRKKGDVDVAIDLAFLRQEQQHAAALACDVIDSVARMDLQFPGGSGPGVPIK